MTSGRRLLVGAASGASAALVASILNAQASGHGWREGWNRAQVKLAEATGEEQQMVIPESVAPVMMALVGAVLGLGYVGLSAALSLPKSPVTGAAYGVAWWGCEETAGRWAHRRPHEWAIDPPGRAVVTDVAIGVFVSMVDRKASRMGAR